MILLRYITRVFAVRFLGALAAFASLVQILDLFNVADDILERGQGVAGLLHYSILRTPVIIVDVVPFAVLIGAIFTLMSLASRNEIVALRALGAPAPRIILLLAPAVLLLGALHVAASDRVAPPAESALRDWMLRTATQEAPAQEARYWLRSGPTLVGFGGMTTDGALLEHVWIYQRDAEGGLAGRIAADRALWQNPLWRLEGGFIDLADGTQQALDSQTIDLGLTPSDVLELSQPLEHLSLNQLHSGATGGPTGARSETFFRTRLMTVWSFLAVPAIMLLIAAPIAFSSARRRGATGLQAALALAWGLGFILVAGVLRTIGESGVIPPFFAVWTAPFLFALAAAARLSDVEKT